MARLERQNSDAVSGAGSMTCSWLTNSIPATQCRWPGAFSNGLLGEAKWRCYMHHKLANEGNRDSVLADAIVEASLDWDNSVAEYVQFRKKFDETPRAMPAAKDVTPAGTFIQDAWKLLQRKRVADAA